MGQKFYFGNIVTLLIKCFILFSEVTHETKNFMLEILGIDLKFFSKARLL